MQISSTRLLIVTNIGQQIKTVEINQREQQISNSDAGDADDASAPAPINTDADVQKNRTLEKRKKKFDERKEEVEKKEETRTRHSLKLADVTSGRRRRVQIANSQNPIDSKCVH